MKEIVIGKVVICQKIDEWLDLVHVTRYQMSSSNDFNEANVDYGRIRFKCMTFSNSIIQKCLPNHYVY